VPIYQTARFQVKPESVDKCKQAVLDFIAYIGENEPQTLLYLAMNQHDSPTCFLHVFVFTDAAARDRHTYSEGVKRFTSVLYPECIAPVEFQEFDAIAWATRAK
jgi:quinol monooxygenase YgiN